LVEHILMVIDPLRPKLSAQHTLQTQNLNGRSWLCMILANNI